MKTCMMQIVEIFLVKDVQEVNVNVPEQKIEDVPKNNYERCS